MPFCIGVFPAHVMFDAGCHLASGFYFGVGVLTQHV